ncbi:MAG: hypothetical protein IPK82_01105 [Polyangiaceae bacterium]|nr:hypothetical protein [Polyangiaceae bacterium]
MSAAKSKPAKPKPKAAKKNTPQSTALALVNESPAHLVVEIKGNAQRRRAEGLLAQIARRKMVIAEEFYDIGLALRELLKKKLFGVLGYDSFGAMLEGSNLMSLSQAHKLIRVVESLPREKAMQLGSEKAALLIGYADATPTADGAEWLLDSGKLPNGKSISEASTRELAQALKKVREPNKKKKPLSPEEVEAQTRAQKVQAALRKQGAKSATAVVLRREGVFWVRVELPAKTTDVLLR